MRSLWLAKGTIIISMQRRMPERKLRKPGLSKPWFLLFFQKGYAIIEQSGKIQVIFGGNCDEVFTYSVG